MKSTPQEIVKRFLKVFLGALIIFSINYFIKALPQMADAGLFSATYASIAMGILLALEKAFVAI